MSDYVLPDTRWHVPGDDCPLRANAIAQILKKRGSQFYHPAPGEEPIEQVTAEKRRCKLASCNKVLAFGRRDDTDYCSKGCRSRHRYAKSGATAAARSTRKHSGQCRKCGTPRPAGERCPKCQAATKQRSNAVQRAKAAKAAHLAILPSVLDAVEVGA